MGHKTKFAKPPEWWKHLRPYNKRKFWKRERLGVRKEIVLETPRVDKDA